ncbi:hypothetical protein PMN64_04935 [Bradyrhizobium sp. UFLA01-814]|uniref:hypothetical protein n=1 Tax=Bradyrhizobium sp. UFLA01-814 TaxID=3023480 RepID=UPI00398B2413
MTIALMVLGATAQAPALFMAAGAAIAKINSFGKPPGWQIGNRARGRFSRDGTDWGCRRRSPFQEELARGPWRRLFLILCEPSHSCSA